MSRNAAASHTRGNAARSLRAVRRFSASGWRRRLRGLPVEHVLDRAPNRTIPASAGPTGKGRGMDVRERGCPRTPGAYASWSWQTYRKRGSSPALRGFPIVWQAAPRWDRTIPARAGPPPHQ